MQIAIGLYPGFTALEILGPNEVLSRLPAADVVFVAAEPGLVPDKVASLQLSAVGFDEVTSPAVVLVGGGPGSAAPAADARFEQWLQAVDRTSTWTAAVGSGSLILARAGLLEDRVATTHWLAAERLAELGVTCSDAPVVIDGKYATAAGVSAGIDLALTLAGLIAGDDVAQAIQLIVEYSPQPPYDAGTPETAPTNLLAQVAARRDELLGTA